MCVCVCVCVWLDLRKPSLLAQQLKSILWLNIKATLSLSRHTKHMGIDSQVCFHRGLFSSLSNHERAPQGLWSHWMALIRMCVVPNCSQQLSWPILWIVAVYATYWTHTTAVCLLILALTGLLLPTHPQQPPPPYNSPTPLYTPSVILQLLWKKLLKNQQC